MTVEIIHIVFPQLLLMIQSSIEAIKPNHVVFSQHLNFADHYVKAKAIINHNNYYVSELFILHRIISKLYRQPIWMKEILSINVCHLRLLRDYAFTSVHHVSTIIFCSRCFE